MAKKRIFRHVFSALMVIIVLSLAVVSYLFATVLRNSYIDMSTDKLDSMALAMLPIVAESLNDLDKNAVLNAKLRMIARETNVRVTLIKRGGKVVAESTRDPEILENHANRPEIKSAFQGKAARSIRFSATLEKETMYYAVPLKAQNGEIIAVLRVAATLRSIDRGLAKYYTAMAILVSSVAVAAILAAFIVARRISSPLEKIRSVAAKIAGGDLSMRLPESDVREIDALASSISDMSDALKKRINETTEGKNELNLILECMNEGVIALDMDERIITMNAAAGKILGVDIPSKNINDRHDDDERIPFAGLGRVKELLDVVERIKKDGVAETLRIEARLRETLILDVTGALIRERKGDPIGILLVLNDVTDLAGLEDMRRNFAANVSHELKTPLTAIRGAVETIFDGALDDKEDARRFLEIIRKHSERLTSLINDTMSLSKIEKDAVERTLSKSEVVVVDVLGVSMDVCREKAEKKECRIDR